MSTASSTRRTTSTCSMDGVLATATSAFGLSGRRGPTPEPPSAVMSTLALRVVDPVRRSSRAEPAEDHRVGGADARAGQHGHGQLGDHRHVDGDPVPLAHTQALERVGGLLHVAVQVGVGDGAGVAGLALPVKGHLVAPAGGHVAVHRVVAHVELPADEPPGERQVPLQDGVPVLEPVEQLGRLAGPEALPVLVRLVVEEGAGGQAAILEALRRRERAVLDEVVLDGGAGGLVGHGGCSPWVAVD
jgi:hypothetical protein